jgi:hypothetical protein
LATSISILGDRPQTIEAIRGAAGKRLRYQGTRHQGLGPPSGDRLPPLAKEEAQEGTEMKKRSLPPLQVGKAYEATDFERFDYFGSKLTGSKAILRLHLKNATTIDLPTSDDELRHLLVILCEAFGPTAVEHLKMRGWV